MRERVTVLGAGLAGCEAAWRCARNGLSVLLYEMRPRQGTPVHRTGLFAELVCSNSLRASSLTNAAGLLKAELEDMDSLVMRAARASAVPAGGALAVDREAFSQFITGALAEHPCIEIRREEARRIPEEGIVIVATGPLTSPALADSIRAFTGSDYLYFYDAIAPVVDAGSIDFEKTFRQSRYGKDGDGEYLNCPLTREQYLRFREALVSAECAPLKDFEKAIYFEGCLPVEEMARRGEDTLRFGPLKPVGLVDSRTGLRPYAAVQLRQDNLSASMFNMVGFQTNLRWPEQERVFRMIPGLEAAEFHRMGQMHRNTYINAPAILGSSFEARRRAGLFFAGQISGVEGYIESAASGLMAGLHAAAAAIGASAAVPPPTTAMGALARYVSHAPEDGYQPMKMNWGIFEEMENQPRDKEAKKVAYAERARWDFQNWMLALPAWEDARPARRWAGM